MASSTGKTSPDLIRSLTEKPESFSFFQTVRLLQRNAEVSGRQKMLRILPELSLSHPNSDVTKVTRRPDDNGYEILTTFLGLYGTSSPLPVWYTEELIDAEREDNTSAKTLLDVIHQRLNTLFSQSATKYRLLPKLIEDRSALYSEILFRLIGIRKSDSKEALPDPHQILRYILLFRQQPRSAAGLEALLEDALRGISVKVIQCVERKVQIPRFQRMVLGQQSNLLGRDAMLGDEIEDSVGKILIRLGPVSLERFHHLLNGSQECKMMFFLIESYINVPLECDLEFILEDNAAKTTELGNPQYSCLGKNAWIFSGSTPGTLCSTITLKFLKFLIYKNATGADRLKTG